MLIYRNAWTNIKKLFTNGWAQDGSVRHIWLAAK